MECIVYLPNTLTSVENACTLPQTHLKPMVHVAYFHIWGLGLVIKG